MSEEKEQLVEWISKWCRRNERWARCLDGDEISEPVVKVASLLRHIRSLMDNEWKQLLHERQEGEDQNEQR